MATAKPSATRALAPVCLAALLCFGAPAQAAPAAGSDPGSVPLAAVATRLTAPLLAARTAALPLPQAATVGDAAAHRWLTDLARGADADERFSGQDAWRAVMGWHRLGDTPFTWTRGADDESAGRYPAANPGVDAALDLAASVAIAWTAANFSCRFPLRARFLLRHHLIRGPLAIDRGDCPDFEAWAAPDRVTDIELLYVGPSFAGLESSAGHLLFRLHRADGPHVTGRSFAPVLAYSVDLRKPVALPRYLRDGLFGGFRATLNPSTSGRTRDDYGVQQQRDIFVYRLVLTRTERRDLLALFWRQARAASRLPYYFFSVNCASMTWDAIRTVAPELGLQHRWFAHPHGIVSRLLAVRRVQLIGTEPSPRTRATTAERTRDRLATKLRDVPGFVGLHAARWQRSAQRAQALRRFRRTSLFARVSAQQGADLARYADTVLDIETHALDVQLGGLDRGQMSPALQAAQNLRADLPILARPRLDPVPTSAMQPSGSRRVTMGTTLGGGAGFELRYGVLDEFAGEARSVALRRAARSGFLVADVRLAWRGGRPHIDWLRGELASIANLGVGPRTGVGWWRSRLGFTADLAVESFLSAGASTGLVASGGPAVTLFNNADFSGHLALGVHAEASVWAFANDTLRGGIGLRMLGAMPVSADHGSRLVIDGRVVPVWTGSGYRLGVVAGARVEFLASARRGVLVGPFGRWRAGQVGGNGWQVGVRVAF